MLYAGLPEDADVSAISNGGYVGLPADAITTPLSRKEQLAKGAPMSNGEASDYMAHRAAFAKEGGVKMFAKAPPTETRKISYTDPGYKPNKPAKSLKEFAKNAVQDVVELPMFPVRMAADIANAPDTVEAVKETAKGLVTTPLGFVPGIAEFATGRTAAENWSTNPGIGALTALGAGELARVGVPKISEFAKTPNVGKLNAKLDTEFTKAVRPSVANTRTGTQAAEFADKAKTAVKEIVLNKDNLGLVNEFGEPVQGLPKNLHEFRQAIDSTKKNLWRKVEDINTAAGEKGAAVPLDSAANELRALADNPVYQTMEPNTISYAQQRADALTKQGSFTVDEAQNAVTLANQSLKSFYQNPTADAASRAYVDSLIANHLRSNLDAALEHATGTPAAHGLRQAYGSLKTIERDVNQRATVDARKNQRGLADFSDIFTAGELVNALASFNPAGVAKAGAMGAVKGLIKHLNDPNTHVRRLFKTADKLVSGVDIPMPEAPKPYSVPTVARQQTVLDAEALPKITNGNLGEAIPGGQGLVYGWEGKPSTLTGEPRGAVVANPEALPPVQSGVGETITGGFQREVGWDGKPLPLTEQPTGPAILNPESLPRNSRSNMGDAIPNGYQREYGWEGKPEVPQVANPEALPPRQSSHMPQLSEQGGRVVPHVEAMTPRVPEGFNPEVIGMGTEDVQLGDRLAPKPRPLRNVAESLENTDAQNGPVAGLSEAVDTQVSPGTAETAPKVLTGPEARAMVQGKTGKPSGTDPARFISDEATYELKQIPLDEFNWEFATDDGAYDGTVNMDRARDYAQRDGNAPPVIAGKRFENSKYNILDGGHRITAAKLRGDDSITALVKVKERRTNPAAEAQPTTPAAHTWKSYLSTHMSRAMKETGGDHGKAMKLLGEEWRKDKSKDPLGLRGGKK